MLMVMRPVAVFIVLGFAVAMAQEAPAPAGDEQQWTEAVRYVAKMRQFEGRVTKLANQARRRQDIVLLNCVNDKLEQLRGNLGVAEQSLEALRRPEVRADTSARSHEFAKVSLTHDKAIVLAQEAETCGGEALRYAGSTQVDTSVDSNLPQEDPTEAPAEDLLFERPPPGSPF